MCIRDRDHNEEIRIHKFLIFLKENYTKSEIILATTAIPYQQEKCGHIIKKNQRFVAGKNIF